MLSVDDSNLVDSRLRKRVCFTDAEIGSEGPNLFIISRQSRSQYFFLETLSPSKMPVSTKSSQPSGILHPALKAKPGKSIPISSRTAQSDANETQRRPSARELFNRLPEGRCPDPKSNIAKPSIRELFNRLPDRPTPGGEGQQGLNAPNKPPIRDLFNHLPTPPWKNRCFQT